ncbi:hypothetical protein SAY86_028471 [Trapa natans]|uniref:DM2 domain-containing protein n=1 Tax=Trapa natans TaxID=22666 RepID=A0AAN7RC85_TRANT|nr:hypothetical protein SAY86_028471 [Trapa natans]
MATDQEISQALHLLLRETFASSSNPNKPGATTFASFDDVVRQLEARLGLNLSQKVDFIRSQIQLLLQPHPLHQPQPQPPPPSSSMLQQPYSRLHGNGVFGVPRTPHFYPNQSHTAAPSAIQSFPSQYVSNPPPAPAARPVDPPKESAPPKPKRKGGAGGLNKLCGVSPELQAIVGHPALPRTEIVKQLWAYIRKHKLQDPSNKRKIICNDELKLVFETDCTDMFKMNKLLAKHIIPLDPTKEPASKKPKAETETGTDAESSPHVKISDALANFFSVDDREMPVAEINKRIWEYINVNQLQDPQDVMLIKCDAKLQEVLGIESLHASGLSDILERQHIIKS